MKGLEERIKELEAASEDLERFTKAKGAEDKEAVVKQLAARNALDNVARMLTVALKQDKMGAIPMSAKSMFNVSVFKHSTLGTARGITSDFDYYQPARADIRGGQRFMDRFAKSFVGNNTTIRKIRPSFAGNAGDVNEGAPKPQRNYTFIQDDYTFSKLAVTDTITQEIILADAGERVANFIIDALVEHIKDELNQRLINYLSSNGTAFNPALFAGLLSIPAGSARWHDLIMAAQHQFEGAFADHFKNVKNGDILLVPLNLHWAIVQDRKGAGLDLYYEVSPVESIALSSIWKDYNGSRIILTHTEGLTIELVDDVQLYYNRIADAADERNLYRVTVEVFYRFVPTKIPLPAIVITNPTADLQAIAP
jgi:hypothetical protein